jgi:hypothetical protein
VIGPQEIAILARRLITEHQSADGRPNLLDSEEPRTLGATGPS